MANETVAPTPISIHTSTQVGLSGPAAYIYDAQLAILQAVEKPEYFADLSMLVLGNMEQAIREADPARQAQIKHQCQQVIAHHVFLGTALLDLMASNDQKRFQSAVTGFGARLVNDMIKAVTESGAEQAKAVASGDAKARVAIASGHPVVAAVAAAALEAAGKRFSAEGEGFLTTIFSRIIAGNKNEHARRRWLYGIESLLAAACARIAVLGTAPSVADIGRRYRRDIVDLYVAEWEENRLRLKWMLIAAGALVGLWILIGAIVHGLSTIGWNIVAVVSKENVTDDAGVTSWTFLQYGLIAGGVLVTATLGWLLLTAFRKQLIGWFAQHRIDKMVRLLDRGKR